MSSLRSTVSSGVASIRSSFNSLGSIASSAYRWGADICSQMAAGVRAAAGSVIAAAENVASRVRSLLHFSVPDEGPLSDADTYMPDFMKLLATGIKKNVKSVVKAVQGLAGSMSNNLTTPVDSLGDWMDSVVGSFATTIKKSQSGIGSAARDVGSGIQSQLMSGLSGVKTQFQQLWTDLQGITKAAVGNMSDEVKQGFADMKTSIGELSSQTSSLGNAIRSLGDTFNSDFLKSLGNGISKVGDTVNTVTGLVDKLGSMKNTIGNLGSTMQNLGNVLGTENGGGLLSNIGSFLSKIGSADGGQIVSNFGNLISGLTSKMGGLGEGITGIISKLGSLSSSGGGILSNLGGLLSGVVTKIGGLGGSLSGLLSGVGSTLGGIAGSAGSAIAGLFGSVGTAVSGLAAGAGTALAGVASSAGGFLASAGTALAGLAGPAGIAVAAVGGIGLGLTALWKNCDGFREGVTNIWNKVTSVFSNGVNAIKNGISNAASAIGNVASSIWGGIKNVASSAVSWGKDIVGGIAGGIKKGVSWVGSAVKSVASGIRSFLHFSVPDEGPLADADTYMPDFMKLLSGGIKKGEGGLISQIRSMAAKVQQGMEGISSFSLPELTLPHFDGSGWNFPQAALAGGGTTRTTNLGGVYITVNGYNARNDDELAQTVADKINGMIHEDDSVFK